MSTTRDRLNAALEGVRVSPALHRRVMRSLRAPQPRRRALLASALAAIVLLFAIFAAPPIVRAAEALFDRFFGGWLTEIERYEALPTDARFAHWMSGYENGQLWYPLEASGEIGGVQATLCDVTLNADDYGMGDYCRLRLKFNEAPPFDLDALRCALSIDGQDVKARDAMGITTIRGVDVLEKIPEYVPVMTDEGLMEPMIAGARRTMDFPIAIWRIEKPIACVLKAELEGAVYEIPFAFDPEQAHQRAVQNAWDDVEIYDRFYAEEKQRIGRAAQNATPVGITKREGDVELTLQYLSYTDGELILTMQAKGASVNRASLPALFWFRLEVEGAVVADVSTLRDSWAGDLLSLASEYTLETQPPEESLIYLDAGEEYPGIRMAFRYRWKDKRVILPKDEAEEAEWIAQGAALGG